MRMAEKWNEKWPKNANCEQPYYCSNEKKTKEKIALGIVAWLP